VKLIAFPGAMQTVADNYNIFKKSKKNHYQNLSSDFKGTRQRVYNLMFCDIIVAPASCTHIRYFTVLSRLTFQGSVLFFFRKLYYNLIPNYES